MKLKAQNWRLNLKAILLLFALLITSVTALAQGKVDFHNTSATLIAVGGTPMPGSDPQRFIFAIFLAPSTTATTANQTVLSTDPAFQIVGGYNTNHPTAVGRLIPRFDLDVGTAGGFGGGSTVDFVIRSWSANLGYTWAEFLVNWNNGNPSGPANEALWWGSSTIGNNIVLNDGDAIPTDTIFGIGFNQVRGFDMVTVPEPFPLALTGLGAAALWLSRRRVLR